MNTNKVKSEIKQTLKRSMILLSIAILFNILSIVADFEFGHDFFQRSGAIIIMIVALVEYDLLKIRDIIHPSETAYVAETRWKEKYGNRYNFITVLSLGLFIYGTLLWGYGDLLIKH